VKTLTNAPGIVLSVPPGFMDIKERWPSVQHTAAVFSDLFSSADKIIRIFSPYVDPTFSGLIAGVKCPVRIVTTPAPGRPPRPNPVLERCSTMADLSVRYLNERRDRALIFQMHSKLISVDAERAYVGSANLTDTSVHYNFELGLLVDNPKTVDQLDSVFDWFYDRAVSASKL
jgi:phosphatidylserine/phosphatidylglycerophosphate/cardiolipin synthase-like enzyme